MQAEQVTAADCYHSEGPVWITGTHWPDGLYYVDMFAGDVMYLADATSRRHIDALAAVIRPRTSGGLVYAIERGFALDEGPDSEVHRLPPLWDDPRLRMNEGGCAPDGSLFLGSMGWDLRPGVGSLFRLDPDHSVSTIATGFSIPNGLAWTPDGGRAYHVDTPTGRIDVLDWDAELGLHGRRPFTDVAPGRPDGLTVDADGGVWVALYGGSAVHRYDPDGSLSAVIEVPVAQVTACTFGGAALDELYITTSRERLADPEPEAGAVFVARPGVRGLPTIPYSG